MTIMTSASQILVWGLLAASGAQAQNYGGGSSRSDDAFSYVQPKNTTILGAYGHSPAVYPSRKTPIL
jgi:beta-glucosidase